MRHDGAPPLYYFLLHGWIRIFGGGDVAVRSMSAVFSLAALPLAWMAGRRAGGRWVAVALLVLTATSPFNVRYATEARMYSLVSLIALGGWLALRAALDNPSLGRLAVVALLVGLLVLTHYWGFYLLGAVAIGLAATAWRARDRMSRRAATRALLAVAAGGLLFVPWLPTFLYQRAHTGTPWGSPPGPIEVLSTTFVDLGGGVHPEAKALAAVLAGLTILAIAGRPIDRWRVELDLRGRPGVRAEFVIALATIVVAVAAGVATSAAFASRYTAVIVPLLLLVAAFGVTAFADHRAVVAVVAMVAVLGLVGSTRNLTTPRTQAPDVAAAIRADGKPDDVVVYCPDQIAPDVHRLLPPGLVELTYPDGGDPRFVDWVDYGARNRVADPPKLAQRVLASAGNHTIWAVWAPGYRTLGKGCEQLVIALQQARPDNGSVVETSRKFFEPENLVRLEP